MNVGEQIKKLRKERKLTIKEVAFSSGITPSLISQIENNMGNPSLNTLNALATALNVEVIAFFDGTFSREEGPVVRGTNQPLLSSSKGWKNFLLTNKTSEKFSATLGILAPKASSADSPELNPKSATGIEFGYVLSGKLHVKLEDKEYDLNTGDSICFDAHKKHYVSNPTNSETKAIWILLP